MSPEPDMWVETPEDIIEGIDDGYLRPSYVCTVIGEKGMLTMRAAAQMAAHWQTLVERYPNGRFAISIYGYDDDQRELWEIAEVVHYVRQWAHLTGMNDRATAWRAFGSAEQHMHSYAFLAACGVFDEEIPAAPLQE